MFTRIFHYFRMTSDIVSDIEFKGNTISVGDQVHVYPCSLCHAYNLGPENPPFLPAQLTRQDFFSNQVKSLLKQLIDQLTYT